MIPVASAGLALQPRIDSASRDKILSSMFGITAASPGKEDTITIAVCAGVYGLTAILLVYAWCNYNYRPIRAKNLTWTTLIYLSTVLWFLGNIPSNGHVRLIGAWSNCKLWILWFRVFFCFVFATMTIVRFYALDRVFNQKKPFTVWSTIISGAIVIAINVVYCLVNQFISGNLTTVYVPSLEVCNVTQAFRIAALTFMWVIWSAVGVLFYRLRNIQSTFNEFRESMAIFAVIIGLLTESTVTNLYYKYYILEKHRRIQKTVVDMAAANLVIWLFIGYPVLMCIFCRKKYEQRWLEKLAKDSPNTAFNANNTTNNGTLYAKMNDNYGSDYYDKQHFDSMDMTTLNHNNHHPFANHRHHPLNIENALNGESLFDANDLPSGLRNNNLHIHRPEASLPEMFSRDYTNPTSNGRHVI